MLLEIRMVGSVVLVGGQQTGTQGLLGCWKYFFSLSVCRLLCENSLRSICVIWAPLDICYTSNKKMKKITRESIWECQNIKPRTI